MSAFLSIRFLDSIQLFADGAAYDAETGVITSFESKIQKSGKVPFAIAVRGSSGLALDHAKILCEIADERGIPDVLAVLRSYSTDTEAQRQFLAEPLALFDFAIALWHPETGPAHYRMHCASTMPDFAPFVLHDLGELCAVGSVFEPQKLFDLGILPVSGDTTIWAETKVVEIIEVMRTMKGEPLPGTSQKADYRIGGHVDLATVTEYGVLLRRVREWKDEIGEPINPFREHENVRLFGNRKERRKAAKLSLKKVG